MKIIIFGIRIFSSSFLNKLQLSARPPCPEKRETAFPICFYSPICSMYWLCLLICKRGDRESHTFTLLACHTRGFGFGRASDRAIACLLACLLVAIKPIAIFPGTRTKPKDRTDLVIWRLGKFHPTSPSSPFLLFPFFFFSAVEADRPLSAFYEFRRMNEHIFSALACTMIPRLKILGIFVHE